MISEKMKCVAMLFVIGLVSMRTTIAEQCLAETDSKFGKEFIFGILDNAEVQQTTTLDIVSESTGSVALEIPFLGINRTYSISPGAVLSIPINSSIHRGETFQDLRGIMMTSTTDISVLVTNYNHLYLDSYVIYPVESIGNNYIVSSYKPYPPYSGSKLMVIGVSDNTTVSIKHGVVLNNLTLNRLEVYQLQASGTVDLTGTTVISNKPVTVLSGSGFSKVPDGVGLGNQIAAQMLPTYTWNDLYIIPPITPKHAFLVRILPETTDFKTTFRNNTSAYTVVQSTITDYLFATDPVVVKSSVPISVVQYGIGHEYDGVVGDPFMALVPGVSQYTNNKTFSVPHLGQEFSHYLAVIVPSNRTNGLLLDGVSFHSSSSISVPRPLNNFTVLTGYVTEGYHTMTHQNKNVSFGLLVYGLNPGFGYGFYAGQNLNAEICSADICNNGCCISSAGSYHCDCFTGYTGTHCTNDIDTCIFSPCCYASTCVNTLGSYTCICEKGYTGRHCELDIDECTTNPCQNNGKCRNIPGSFLCLCSGGFDGEYCENDVDECSLSPCKNNGSCFNTNGSFVCECPNGLFGNICDIDLTKFMPNTICQNGGTSTIQNGKLICNCNPDFTGYSCDHKVDACASRPCQHGGTCEPLPGSYTCYCTAGYMGQECSDDYDECVYSPCAHGGTCLNTPGSFSCKCLSGFIGQGCASKIDYVLTQTTKPTTISERTVQPCEDDPHFSCTSVSGFNNCSDDSIANTHCKKTCGKCDELTDWIIG